MGRSAFTTLRRTSLSDIQFFSTNYFCFFYQDIFHDFSRPMVRVMPLQGYWWAGRGNAILVKPTSSHRNCLNTRRLPRQLLHVVDPARRGCVGQISLGAMLTIKEATYVPASLAITGANRSMTSA